MTAPLDDRDHALYRFFGAGGTLLYIGITMNLPTRTGDHRDGKPWWLAVASMTVEHFPDRASVLEAERRAIRAERPLYNVQHNRPDPKPVSRDRVAPSSPLVAICMDCRKKIPGDKGSIHIQTRDTFAAAQALAERRKRKMRILIAAESIEDPAERSKAIWETRVSTGRDLIAEYNEIVEVDWMVHCDDCNPHSDGEGGLCAGCYWFSTDRCRTWAQLIEWTVHLSEKRWFEATNWMDWIRSIAHGATTVGLVAQPADTYGAAGC